MEGVPSQERGDGTHKCDDINVTIFRLKWALAYRAVALSYSIQKWHGVVFFYFFTNFSYTAQCTVHYMCTLAPHGFLLFFY